MKKKTIKSSRKKWRAIDLTLILAMVIGIILAAIFIASTDGKESFFMSLWATFFLGIITCTPVIMIYLAIRTATKHNERKNVVFDAVDNIDYYRENLGEFSPGLISLMMDLDIDHDKDITAMLLYLKSKQVIDITDDKGIIVKSNYNSSVLTESDISFIEWIKTRQYSYLQLWKTQIEKEAHQAGYIKPKENKLTGCLYPIIIQLVIMILLIILGFSIFNEDSISILENINIPINASILEQVKYIFSTTGFVWLIIKLILFVILFIAFGCLPLFRIVYFITANLSKAKVKRTKLGNQLTEKIYAMKNFIHDFGNLSEVTKEHLLLWDYFLIYAVVLEENEEIVNEISKCQNINIRQFSIDKMN